MSDLEHPRKDTGGEISQTIKQARAEGKEAGRLEGLREERNRITDEVKNLIKVALRSAWCYNNGLRIGRDDAIELCVFSQRVAMLLYLLPFDCSAKQSREFMEQITGLSFEAKIAEGGR